MHLSQKQLCIGIIEVAAQLLRQHLLLHHKLLPLVDLRLHHPTTAHQISATRKQGINAPGYRS